MFASGENSIKLTGQSHICLRKNCKDLVSVLKKPVAMSKGVRIQWTEIGARRRKMLATSKELIFSGLFSQVQGKCIVIY